jgi:hypothetical protein
MQTIFPILRYRDARAVLVNITCSTWKVILDVWHLSAGGGLRLEQS